MTCGAAQATSAMQYENCGAPGMGLMTYPGEVAPGDSNAAALQAAVAQSKPQNAPKFYTIVAEAMLRSGGLLMWRQTPGDCGAPQAIPGISSGQVVGLSGQAASGVLGGLEAVGVLSGPATLGIGSVVSLAVGGIESIFSHHDQAVKREQDTICSVANYFNPAKQAIDNAVRTGQISAAQGVAYLTQIANQAKSGLTGIMQSCNAACYYSAILQAFINYAKTWYFGIAPIDIPTAQAPGAAPAAYGTPPGGVLVAPGNPAPPAPVRSQQGSTYAPAILGSAPALTSNQNLPGNSSASDYLNQGYNQQTGQSGQLSDTPETTNWLMIAAIVLGIIAFIFVVGGNGE